MAIPHHTHGQGSGLITRQSLHAIQAAQELEYGESFGSAVWGQWRGVLAGLAVIGIIVGGYFAMNKGALRVFERFWTNSSALPGIDDAYKRSGMAEGATKDLVMEQVHNECRARGEAAGRNATPQGTNHATEGALLVKQAAYLACVASERPSRICQPGHRGHLLMAVRDYYRVMGRMRGDRGAAQAIASASAVSTAQAASDPQVLEALKMLVQKGYVGKRDLLGAASGLPNDLEAALLGVEATQRGCG